MRVPIAPNLRRGSRRTFAAMHPHHPYTGPYFAADVARERSRMFYEFLDQRRSIRAFSDRPVAREIIENVVKTASTAPSGAHKQPWMFCAIENAATKRRIRAAAEAEERKNYGGRMSEEWLADLAKFGTDWQKPFLEIAPWLIVLLKKPYDLGPDGERSKNYYVNESVGIAAGMLIAAIHNAGLVTLTHTPSPLNFLEKILERPANERAVLLLPVGYPAEGAEVPELVRKPLGEVLAIY